MEQLNQKSLNLINCDKSDIPYNIIQFPDGEKHIVLDNLDHKSEITIKCRITSSDDLFILLQIGDILNRHEVSFHLCIYYLMGMRMDRVISFNEAFSLKIVANLICSINPKSVYILEPHSSVAAGLLKANWSHFGLAKFLIGKSYTFVLPDNGAYLRYSTVTGSEAIVCSKVRESNGDINHLKITNPELLNTEKPLCVIDDLCDGGRTFVKVAEEIRKFKPGAKIDIFVTHMVNSKGIENLSQIYNNVYFTNSYKDWQNEQLPNNVSIIDIFNED